MMVRRKDDTDSSGVEPNTTDRQPASQSSNDGSATKKVLLWFLAIVVLLGIGWGGAQLVMSSMSGSSGGNILSGLFGQTELEGEERGRVNFAVLGVPGEDSGYDGPYLTDTVLVASLNLNEDKTKVSEVNMFSLPRDMHVTLPGVGDMKLNAVYRSAEVELDDPVEPTKTVISNVLGIPIDYYTHVNFSGFEQLVDELGGITVNVEESLVDNEYPDGEGGFMTVEFEAGEQQMDGTEALQFARSRKSTSDFDRARRQQKVLMAIRDRAASMDLLTSPEKAIAIFNILKDSISTDLGTGEIKRLTGLVQDLSSEQVTTTVFDDSADSFLEGNRIDDQYVLQPRAGDFSEIHEYVADVLAGEIDPQEEMTEPDPVTLEVLNGTTTPGLAGNNAERLRQNGYEVLNVGNNPQRGFINTQIIDLGEEEPASQLENLAQFMEAEIAEDTTPAPNTDADVRIILGSSAESLVQ